MKAFQGFLKLLLWFLFFLTFTFEFIKIVFELSPSVGHQNLSWANASFWTSLFLIEMIMAGMIIYSIVNYPQRRKRLITLSVAHFSVILVLPTVLDDWSWTCLLYPWPHSLQAFDPLTPGTAFAISAFVGFLFAPVITYRWGMKGFCGYVCPHGAFFSETYGRVFAARLDRLAWATAYIPRMFFALMAIGLIAIMIQPALIVPLRNIQKYIYFSTAEYFYFVIGIPLLGGRSYCRLICPMGYYLKLIVRFKQRIKSKKIKE